MQPTPWDTLKWQKPLLTARIDIFEAVTVKELGVLALVPTIDEDIAELIGRRVLDCYLG
jgi:hypothetical protein